MSDPTVNDHLRQVDHAAIAALEPGARFVQRLLDRSSGAEHVTVSAILTPDGGGSPEGMHIHPFDQVVYVLRGEMSFEVDGRTFTAGPDSLVTYKAGVPHRNWNGGTEPTLHLAINAPLTAPDVPRSTPYPG